MGAVFDLRGPSGTQILHGIMRNASENAAADRATGPQAAVELTGCGIHFQ